MTFDDIVPYMDAGQYYLKTVPQIFIDADTQLKAAHANDPATIREPRKIPMPFIKGVPGVKGPLLITEDWYVKQRKKVIAQKVVDKRDFQVEMMQLLAKRDRLRHTLGKLDPTNRKDSKRIVSINIKLKDIDAELQMLQEQSGVNMNELDHGTRFGRYVGHFQRAVKKGIKKIKKFYNRHAELINNMALIIIPTIFGGLIKKLAGVFLS